MRVQLCDRSFQDGAKYHRQVQPKLFFHLMRILLFEKAHQKECQDIFYLKVLNSEAKEPMNKSFA
jgi:hypothetical protein